MTGVNYSKRRRVDRVTETVGGGMAAAHDPAERSVSPAIGKPREITLSEPGGQKDFGARRIDAHPILGELPAAQIVTFTFDGSPIQGRAGEPIAASLFVAGIRVLRTMPRFDDARGGFCMIGRCTDCMVVVDGVTNVRACITPVAAGLEVRTQRGLSEAAGHEPEERRT